MKVSAGNALVDSFLEGGYESDIVSTIYGPAGSGKTLFCLLTAIKIAENQGKVVYIDTEGVSVERIKQLSKDYKKILDNILFLKPTTFEEQKNAFERLNAVVNEKVKLIIIDTISMLYRLEMGKSNDVYEVNKTLGQQIGWLNEIARKKDIPVLVTNQVYASMDKSDEVKIVGGDFLRYGSKCMIELQCLNEGKRKAILRKHRSIDEKQLLFKIAEKGIKEI